jgi:hypothetical protein
VSGAGELPPCALSEPDLNLSAHPAPIIQPWVLHQTANAEISNGFALFKDSSHCLVDLQIKLDDSPPSLHLHYEDFIATTG